MATFTPTASSTAIAGASLWGLLWTIANHLDSIVAPFGIRMELSRTVRNWVNKNKVLTLCMTEVINLSHAGLSPLGTTFAIGGTAFNLIYVGLINPIFCWHDRKRQPMRVVPATSIKQVR
ncbi:MAG: hypothetical protein WA766_03125 [Candidatus Acidiferrales bacterium]